MMQSFEDLFSSLAREYARYRPTYPESLAGYLASLAPDRALAWDCATGSGQAAVQLATEFDLIVASDASFEQVRRAECHPNVAHFVSLSETSPLPSRSVSLVTVAQAVHWFDLEQFYTEARRALKPGGVLAVWGYIRPEISPQIDALMNHYYSQILGPYWSPRMRYLDELYRTLPFPFDEIIPPEFTIETCWDLNQVIGFMASWSATRAFQADKGFHPLEQVYPQIAQAWGDPNVKRTFRSPLFFRIGRKDE